MEQQPQLPGAPPPRKRRRAKMACEPCRERKRKCNGQQPCDTCVQSEYDCSYAALKSGRHVRLAQRDGAHTPAAGGARSSEASPHSLSNVSHGHGAAKDEPGGGDGDVHDHAQSIEANCGAAFVRKLGLQVDPQNAPRLHLFAWNTGERLAGCLPGSPRPITSMLSHANMVSLASVYFQKVAVVYIVLDRESFMRRLHKRWADAAPIDSFDKVLCGVAALGLHFSQRTPPQVEPDIVETARALLEQDSLFTPPSVDTVTGWILRVAYLRMTSLPHTTWLASCTLMHVIEAANIHQEIPSQSIFDGSSDVLDLDTRRRLWGLAQHLNTWASYDLGRTKITLSNSSTKPAPSQPGNAPPSILTLISTTEALDPNRTRSLERLESDLAWLLDQVFDEPPAVMAQVNLLLCIFRRLRAQKSNTISVNSERILQLAVKGLRAAQGMVAQYSPWHHAANVPFQIICLLLAIDSRQSLNILQDALSVLKQVKDTWDSDVMREAYDTAYLLVLMHHRQKEQDLKTLRDALGLSSADLPQTEPIHSLDTSSAEKLQPPLAGTGEVLWLDSLITDTPGLRDFDLQQFLIQDAMPPYDLDGGDFAMSRQLI